MDLEASFASKVFSALSTWLAKVRDAVMAAWKSHKRRPDPLAVQATKPLWIRLVDGLQEELRRAALQGYSEVANAPKSAHIQLIEQKLAKSRQLMVRIPDELQQEIQFQINVAVNRGATPQQIADVVDRMLDVSGSERWSRRAKVIAATEVHRMANMGVQAAGMAVSRLESVRLNKRWKTRHDDRVRPDHVMTDGQVVPLNSMFKVGVAGVPMLCPGDPDAPADQTIECRCSMDIEDVT